MIISVKTKFYERVQQIFKKSYFLSHFNSDHQLYIDLNTFKEQEFEMQVYHVKSDFTEISVQSIIQLIIFLLKLLSDAEFKYWSTELEMMTLVWTIHKIRQMMKTIIRSIIVFIDHSVTTFVVKQIKLSSFKTDKLNLHLVRISQYLLRSAVSSCHCCLGVSLRGSLREDLVWMFRLNLSSAINTLPTSQSQ